MCRIQHVCVVAALKLFFFFLFGNIHLLDITKALIPPEWRAGVAGHLILSDEDLTSVVQGSWKRLNTLQHYKVSASQTNTSTHTHTISHHQCMCRLKQ